MKKFDLESNCQEGGGRMHGTGSHRFGQAPAKRSTSASSASATRALAWCPFACKLPGELTRAWNERAQSHEAA